MIKISVILTTYNGETAIEKTMQSILNQEGNQVAFQMELIVVDDCSTDNTVALIKNYDCRLIENPTNSGGPNQGRNIGLKLATGDYICIADQDDIWHSNKIKAILPYLNHAPIITSGYLIVDKHKHKKIDKINRSEAGFIFYESNVTFMNILQRNFSGQQTYLGSIVYHKSLQNILFEEEVGMLDYDWLLRLFHQQTSLEVSQTLYTRIVEGQNLSLNADYRAKDFAFALQATASYEKLYPQAVKKANKRIHGTYAKYFYLMGDMRQARIYLKKSAWNFKNLLYYTTTYIGSKFVIKHFNVFG